MKFKDLRDFVQQLEQRGELKRIQIPVSPVLEMTEICDRTLRAKGPALLFENPTGHTIPVLGNLFGTPERVAIRHRRRERHPVRCRGQRGDAVDRRRQSARTRA